MNSRLRIYYSSLRIDANIAELAVKLGCTFNHAAWLNFAFGYEYVLREIGVQS